MLVIGLTGGIGSGKTTVAQIFHSFGVPVYNSDVEAKKILFSNTQVHQELKTVFGDSIFTDGIPDRVKLARIVFSDKEKLAQLNQIIHPKLANHFKAWKAQQTAKVVLKEAAILIESRMYKSVDKIVVVTAPEELRIQRVLERDSSSKEEIQNRINNQLSEEERLKYADFVIDNSGSQHLIPQVEKIIKEFM